MMVIETEYSIEDIVYLVTDKEQCPRIVTCLRVTKTCVLYEVMSGLNISVHYGFELSKNKDFSLTT